MVKTKGMTARNPYIEATEATEELGRTLQGLVREAEEALSARGIEPDPSIPVLDQLADPAR